MSSEQLIQNELLDENGLKGSSFGKFEKLKLGATTVDHLIKAGLVAVVKNDIVFSFQQYKRPKVAKQCKPDNLINLR
jgi:type I restriction enzyme M protein